jgi:peptide/nickel transport system substrate-binding protein
VIRPTALLAAIAVSLLAVSGAGGAGAQTPKRGGTLVYAQPTPEPACLTPFRGRCAPGTSWILLDRVHNLVLERAFDFGPHLERRPRLVSTVEYTRKPPFALTYHIRPEARWSDGVPVTSRDFVFTLRALRKLDPTLKALHKAIRSIRAIDAKTVRVFLRPRTAVWPSFFGNILPSHALRGEDLTTLWTDRIDNPKTGMPIGSGPFLVERWVRGKELVLRRNPNYWGPHPAYLDRLVLRIGVDPDDMLGSFRRGELHVAWGFPPDLVSEFRREPGARIDSTPGTGKDFLVIRDGPGGNPALRDKRVRRALAYAVDRVAIVRAIFGNVDSRIQPGDSVVYLTRDRHYRPNWNRYRSRRSVARELLQQAGCSRGADGIYTCAGQRLSLRIVTSAGRVDRARAVELMQAQLRGVGIEVLPTFLPPPVLFDRDSPVNRGEFDLALLGWLLEPGAEAEFFHDLLACGGIQNVAGYCQRLVTRDLDQARRILDPRQQARVLNRADVQLAKDVPAIPLHELLLVAARRTTVRGFVLSPLPPQLVDAESWWLER